MLPAPESPAIDDGFCDRLILSEDRVWHGMPELPFLGIAGQALLYSWGACLPISLPSARRCSKTERFRFPGPC